MKSAKGAIKKNLLLKRSLLLLTLSGLSLQMQAKGTIACISTGRTIAGSSAT